MKEKDDGSGLSASFDEETRMLRAAFRDEEDWQIRKAFRSLFGHLADDISPQQAADRFLETIKVNTPHSE